MVTRSELCCKVMDLNCHWKGKRFEICCKLWSLNCSCKRCLYCTEYGQLFLGYFVHKGAGTADLLCNDVTLNCKLLKYICLDVKYVFKKKSLGLVCTNVVCEPAVTTRFHCPDIKYE